MRNFWIANWMLALAFAGDSSHNFSEPQTFKFNSDSAQLLLAHRYGLLRLELGTHTTTLLLNSSATGVDYHYNRSLLFWCDDYNNKVYMKRFDEPTITTFSAVGQWSPASLAVDWVSHKLYVADALGRKVHVFDLDASWQTVVLGELRSPSDIALDPLAGFMFVGDIQKVVRANMDGSEAKAIVSEDSIGYSETGVALDLEAKKLFYCNSVLDYIQSVDYDGNNKQVVVKSPEPNAVKPVRLAVFKGLFWSDSINRNVGSASGASYSTLRTVYNTTNDTDLVEPKGLTVLHPHKQTPSPNPCGENNGGCSHMCVLTSRERNRAGFTCICNAGYVLKTDNKTCVEPKEFLLYTRKTMVQGNFFPISVDRNDTMYLDVSTDTRFVGLDFDSNRGHIYYTDIIDSMLYRVNKDGTEKKIITKFSGILEGLAFDWLANNLYYTDSKSNVVGVLSTSNGAIKRLIKGLDRPRGIVVYPSKALIFFTDWGKFGGVFRANSDGSQKSMIVNATGSLLNGLSLDFDTHRLYWCDAKQRVIKHSTLDGKDIQVINSKLIRHPFAIVVHKSYVYFSDWYQFGIVRLDKLTGEEGKILFKVERPDNFCGVKVYSSEVQPVTEDHPCYLTNANCQHLCLAFPSNNTLSVKCECSDGYQLASDNVTCVKMTSN